ncbi:TetR/AcrR family transcriptional regulator [Pseudonocardia acaciae]|uniref:TetR/AcrR family transcriptional regulator n=1 Tax=Pseudonocardia acaciae TaxID=551276 RepID=UPI00048BE646|nr:TetR/AcrR family transcriptional regulator [Pseudonocardia acaciae]
MNAARTARERARAELTREIADEARRQLAESGPNGLSLRAVARELGMVSSALYRYFPSRDDLLTALILDAYGAVGAAAEKADRSDLDPVRRWLDVCAAVRDWARAHPHEYALVYGSPVPGYQAPRSTVPEAARVPLVLVGVVRDAWAAGSITPPADRPEPGPLLSEQLRELAASVAPELPAPVLTCALIAWTQLFGMISFELFGQLVGSVDPTDEFFANATARMAELVGLAPVAA